ncbi:MAG: 50S ribosomal protein L23 [Candidatus Paceibacterota bacterium]
MKKATVTKTKKAEKVKDTKTHPLIKGLRMTEKSALGADKGVYTFNVMPNSTKNEIKKAIKVLYGVTPVKVGITQVAKKVIFRRGVLGTKSGGKKAVVYLKKGDTITFA